MLHSDPKLFNQLLEKITDALLVYFDMQIDSGVDVLQIFDSWGGLLSYDTFWDASAKYMARLVDGINGRVPVIVYSKGSHNWTQSLQQTKADVLGLDWTVSIAEFHDKFERKFAVQGNLDPVFMSTSPEIVEQETLRILTEFGRREGHIFNLGHGIHPDGKLECMHALVETVINFDKNKL